MTGEIYETREDSLLFIELLEKYLINQKRILDMGTGSGILAIFAKKKLPNSIVIGTDINPKAIETARKNANGLDINFIESDLFDNINNIEVPNGSKASMGTENNGSQYVKNASEMNMERSGLKFDLIIFNPPYLPTKDNVEGKEMWQEGNVIKRFLKNAPKFLKKNGKILILKSSLTKTKISGKVLIKKKIPWETLEILEI